MLWGDASAELHKLHLLVPNSSARIVSSYACMRMYKARDCESRPRQGSAAWKLQKILQRVHDIQKYEYPRVQLRQFPES